MEENIEHLYDLKMKRKVYLIYNKEISVKKQKDALLKKNEKKNNEMYNN